MLYNGNNPAIKIIGVEHCSWKASAVQVAPRGFSALTFRIRGKARVWAQGKEYSVDTNELLYLPQGIAYQAEYTDTEMLVIHFQTLYEDQEPAVYSFENGETLYKMFLQALSLWKKKAPGYVVQVMAQFYSILSTIEEGERKAVLPEWFLQGISFINSNYKDSALSVEQICEAAGISPTAFRNLFKKHYDKTPVSYITDLRLEAARNLIAEGVSVEEAAYKSGFNDSKYFARVVKKQFGCTPRDFKDYAK